MNDGFRLGKTYHYVYDGRMVINDDKCVNIERFSFEMINYKENDLFLFDFPETSVQMLYVIPNFLETNAAIIKFRACLETNRI